MLQSMLLLAALLLVNIFIGIKADISYEMFKDKEYPNHCVVLEDRGKAIIQSGQERRYPGKCAHIVCGLDGWGLVYTCERTTPPDNCEFGDYINFMADFPECCERVVVCNDAY
ncbi:uncharacterized protein LOC115630468 [Scaptodrosophila lebanonensis]|uniref:Uncharacterized protein LOC115630468 n=1 Tax=Drosophila lebanonensis TaxID=7225 RepID=A0A6J2U5V0_DROLE|nr:uncharacterized protein LOC115630468 [Scaptodrosophila lebanonensis]